MIDPDAIYSIGEVCDLAPSSHRGKRLHQSTVFGWIATGKLKAARSRAGRLAVRGQDLLDFLGLEVVPFPVSTPADRRRSYERALKRLRAKGLA